MFDIITIGGATRDIFFSTDEAKVLTDGHLNQQRTYMAFEYGAKIIPDKANFSYGGGGINTAISFAKLGLKVATIARVGVEGTGNLIVKELEKAGVTTTFVERDHVNHTALSMIVSVPGHDHTMFLYRGANDHLTVKDWRPIKTRWLYIASLTGMSAETIPEAFSFARAHKIKVAWNPGSEQLKGGYLEMSSYLEETDILILNREEAIRLVLSKNQKIKITDEKELLKELYIMTGGIVVITDGPQGSYVTDGKTDYFQAAINPDMVAETTGAGDAYGSTFVATQLMGNSIAKSMKMSATNSASVITKVGAQNGLMTIKELQCTIDLSSKSKAT